MSNQEHTQAGRVAGTLAQPLGVQSTARVAAVRRSGTALFLGATMLGLVTAAQAGEIFATVDTVFQPVSLSISGSEPVASYRVKVTNTSNSNTISRARLVGTTSVTNGGADARAVFKSATTYVCTTMNAENTSIDCAIGNLAPGQSSQEFTVTFTAPTSGDTIAFAWQAVFDQGVPPGNSNGEAGTSTIALAPIDSNSVKSDIPANIALTFFTGTGVATAQDTWVTRVKVPATSAAAIAEIVENANELITCARAADLTTCSTSTLTIPGGTFGTAGARPLTQFLEITFLRDASTISNGAKLSSATIYYRQLPTDSALPVLSCTDTTYGALPQPGRPCEDRTQRKEFPRKNSARTPVEPGYERDWQFVIYAVGNGKYEQ